jgi:hypothetical protein
MRRMLPPAFQKTSQGLLRMHTETEQSPRDGSKGAQQGLKRFLLRKCSKAPEIEMLHIGRGARNAAQRIGDVAGGIVDQVGQVQNRYFEDRAPAHRMRA